ncbi:hypothetical protein GH714_029647 [Hevea brasiliensis]|uniref:G patch domain-containing protein n=1 Tax=Hevea brasiliensis TaxID=3981 RepID=A0A6A6NK93_HEVBR|nr:hypothetical protein GH714_029647 [Hevea brasiliensis]
MGVGPIELIEREEELTSRKKKAFAEASGHLRTLPSWKQEVRDEEGRRRFHGAFTGGFSAGYYSTLGSEEGWTPRSFTSSCKNRAEVKQQSILNFLDEDEKAELEGRSLGISSQFDTRLDLQLLNMLVNKLRRNNSRGVLSTYLQELEIPFLFRNFFLWPSAIPGPVLDEIVLPATESIGVKLLLKMWWRHGHSIKDSHANLLCVCYAFKQMLVEKLEELFLAFSSDDAQAHRAEAELSEDCLGKLRQSVNDDVQTSQSTPRKTGCYDK